LISAGIRSGKSSSPSEAIRGGFQTLKDGADTVYFSQSPNTGHFPRHIKKYVDFSVLEAELQSKRVAAFKAFEDGSYPEDKQEVHLDVGEYQEFLNRTKQI
jgi:hypothetical protein